MTRIAECFTRLRESGRSALVPFVTTGDPNASFTVALMHTLVESGADIVELGVPFSDPMADGPVIQRASERALAGGMSLAKVLEVVQVFRTTNSTTPIVLMGYTNPIEVYGYQAFTEAAARASVDGVLTVDLPLEEGDGFFAGLRDTGLDPIFLLAPTSGEPRMAKICAQASGYLYYVSMKGVTGAAGLDVAAVSSEVAAIKAHTDLPVAVGFGIRDPATAARVAGFSDAVIVGSALVQLVEDNIGDSRAIHLAVGSLLSSMRAAIDGRSGQDGGNK